MSRNQQGFAIDFYHRGGSCWVRDIREINFPEFMPLAGLQPNQNPSGQGYASRQWVSDRDAVAAYAYGRARKCVEHIEARFKHSLFAFEMQSWCPRTYCGVRLVDEATGRVLFQWRQQPRGGN